MQALQTQQRGHKGDKGALVSGHFDAEHEHKQEQNRENRKKYVHGRNAIYRVRISFRYMLHKQDDHLLRAVCTFDERLLDVRCL